LIHAAFPILFKKEELPRSDWMAANFYDSISRISVPIFFMISGYLLLGRKESSMEFFRKRFLKVGIPTVVWIAAYLAWQQDDYRNGSMTIPHIGLSMIKGIFNGHYELHLWFMLVLLGLYLLMPILRALANTSPAVLNYFLLMWLVANPLWELFSRITGEPVGNSVRLFLVEGYAGYLILGYVLGQMELSTRGRWIAIAVFVISALVIYVGTDLISQQAGQVDSYFYNYLGFAVIAGSTGFFLWLKSLGKDLSGKNITLLKPLSNATFGMYFIHVFVLEGMQKSWFGFNLYGWMGPAVYMVPLTAIVAFTISFGIVFLIQKIPLLKYIV
jgi:surface polysaccharide O-acyltransferase-like enzyme